MKKNRLKKSQIFDDGKNYVNCYGKFEHIILNELNFIFFEYRGGILEINKERTAYIPVSAEITK